MLWHALIPELKSFALPVYESQAAASLRTTFSTVDRTNSG